MASAAQATPETLVTVKVSLDGVARRFKLPLRDVGSANVLESKLRNALNIPDHAEALFERYSDSAAAYVILDQANTAVYRQLYRAAKAKHKLKLRVTLKGMDSEEEKQGPKPAAVTDEAEEENRPSVEPTDTEREPEQLVTAEEQPVHEESPVAPAEPAEQQVTADSAPEPTATEVAKAKIQAMKEMLEERLKECNTPASPDAPLPASACAAGCPEMRASYAVCCNSCDRTIPDAHYHCSTCDDGDFDLCQDCVDHGVTCKGTNHWLIKRFVKEGVIINSTTERLAPKPKPKTQTRQPVSAAPTVPERIIPVFNDFLYSGIRTCNCCVAELPEAQFVHCTTCEDFDLCQGCFAKNRHGHHPSHAFVPVVAGTRLNPEVTRRLAAGRGERHSAICDGCDNGIRGVRHKCLDCPDWDYCSSCVVNAGFIHPGHRFVPIYEPLEYRPNAVRQATHVGICCDGPLCSSARVSSSYIVGDRYKCAVCHDTDFCASCEASPANTHNRTHPLIKFKTPVRHVSVTTTGENMNGRQIPTMGDRPSPPRAVETTPVAEASTSPSLLSGVQTVVDVKPYEPLRVEKKVSVTVVSKKIEQKPAAAAKPDTGDALVATYVQDTVEDGTVFEPDHVFEQTWFLRNTGSSAWPAGCSVRYVGGDYMGSLPSDHAAATRDVQCSFESPPCDAPVQPGETYAFTVVLRSPPRPGRYVSYWRLSTGCGSWFGHRLWCDVVVKPKEVTRSPSPVAEPVKEEEEKKCAELVVEPEVKLEVEQKAVEEKQEEKHEEDVVKPEHSQMIFPKLEKESPVASVHEEIKAESVSAQEDEYEDCEDVEWQEGEVEEGYLTDEEYDILDASDEEFHHDTRPKQK